MDSEINLAQRKSENKKGLKDKSTPVFVNFSKANLNKRTTPSIRDFDRAFDNPDLDTHSNSSTPRHKFLKKNSRDQINSRKSEKFDRRHLRIEQLYTHIQLSPKKTQQICRANKKIFKIKKKNEARSERIKVKSLSLNSSKQRIAGLQEGSKLPLSTNRENNTILIGLESLTQKKHIKEDMKSEKINKATYRVLERYKHKLKARDNQDGLFVNIKNFEKWKNKFDKIRKSQRELEKKKIQNPRKKSLKPWHKNIIKDAVHNDTQYALLLHDIPRQDPNRISQIYEEICKKKQEKIKEIDEDSDIKYF